MYHFVGISGIVWLLVGNRPTRFSRAADAAMDRPVILVITIFTKRSTRHATLTHAVLRMKQLNSVRLNLATTVARCNESTRSTTFRRDCLSTVENTQYLQAVPCVLYPLRGIDWSENNCAFYVFISFSLILLCRLLLLFIVLASNVVPKNTLLYLYTYIYISGRANSVVI